MADIYKDRRPARSSTSERRRSLHLSLTVWSTAFSCTAAYVGQTTRAGSRLCDLPIGQSHHLANIFPRVIWSQVVVVDWRRLAEEAELLARIDTKTLGLALEYRLQMWAQPIVGATSRTGSGGWPTAALARSMSIGAAAGSVIDALFRAVQTPGDRATTLPGLRSWGRLQFDMCIHINFCGGLALSLRAVSQQANAILDEGTSSIRGA